MSAEEDGQEGEHNRPLSLLLEWEMMMKMMMMTTTTMMMATACRLYLSCAILNQSALLTSISGRFVLLLLLLYANLRLRLPSGLFHSDSPPFPCIHQSSSPYVLHVLIVSIYCIWSSVVTFCAVMFLLFTFLSFVIHFLFLNLSFSP